MERIRAPVYVIYLEATAFVEDISRQIRYKLASLGPSHSAWSLELTNTESIMKIITYVTDHSWVQCKRLCCYERVMRFKRDLFPSSRIMLNDATEAAHATCPLGM